MKKLFSFLMALSVLFCFGAVAFAEGTGADAFASAVTTQLSADAIWGAITPLVPLIAVITLIAVARYVATKNLRGVKTGKSGRV